MSVKFALGSLHFGSPLGRKESHSIIDAALDLGINNFEVAPIYGGGHAREVLAEQLNKHKNQNWEVLLKYGLIQGPCLTKATFCVRAEPLGWSNFGPELRTDVERFIGRVAAVQLHAPHPEHDFQAICTTFEKLCSSGTRIGISNASPEEFNAFRLLVCDLLGYHAPLAVQYQANVFEQKCIHEFGPSAPGFNLTQIANRILCRGILTSRLCRNTSLPIKSRVSMSPRVGRFFSLHERELRTLLACLDEFAATINVCVEHVAIKYLAEVIKGEKVFLVGVSSVNQLIQLFAGYREIEHLLVEDTINSIISRLKMGELINRLPRVYFET